LASWNRYFIQLAKLDDPFLPSGLAVLHHRLGGLAKGVRGQRLGPGLGEPLALGRNRTSPSRATKERR
jgi:hypothetical protein